MEKQPKKYVITTCCDAKYGEFLVNHWLKSLQENVCLDDIDIVVLDYGLTESQRATLQTAGVRCFPCEKNGYVCNLRYRDLVRLLDDTPYEQLMSVDSGDVIFQTDISHLFSQSPDKFRAVAEEIFVPFYDAVIAHTDIRRENLTEMLDYLRNKPILNCGMLLGPAALFRAFWSEYQLLCKDFASYGVDQFAFNYFAYRNRNFELLDSTYNFVIVSMAGGFSIRNGLFYDRAGKKIAIVHNAGNSSFLRTIKEFGYGPQYNRRKYLGPILIRIGVGFLTCWTRSLAFIRRRLRPSVPNQTVG